MPVVTLTIQDGRVNPCRLAQHGLTTSAFKAWLVFTLRLSLAAATAYAGSGDAKPT